MAGAVFVAKAVYMPSAFQCFAFLKKRNVILNLFQHLIPLFLFLGLTSLRATPFYVLRTFEWLRTFLSLRPFFCQSTQNLVYQFVISITKCVSLYLEKLNSLGEVAYIQDNVCVSVGADFCGSIPYN